MSKLPLLPWRDVVKVLIKAGFIIVRIDPHSRGIVGFTIINFTNVFLKRFITKEKPIELTLSTT